MYLTTNSIEINSHNNCAISNKIKIHHPIFDLKRLQSSVTLPVQIGSVFLVECFCFHYEHHSLANQCKIRKNTVNKVKDELLIGILIYFIISIILQTFYRYHDNIVIMNYFVHDNCMEKISHCDRHSHSYCSMRSVRCCHFLVFKVLLSQSVSVSVSVCLSPTVTQ